MILSTLFMYLFFLVGNEQALLFCRLEKTTQKRFMLLVHDYTAKKTLEHGFKP